MAKGSETGGCLNCYAARFNSRNLPELKSPTTGKPFARILDSGPRWTGDVELIESQLMLPLKWRKPKRIFVNSMSDLFHENLSDEAIDRVFAVMALCPQHTFQVLTKRPERMPGWSGRFEGVMTAMRRMGVDVAAIRWPLPNIWLGVSVENQKTADARIPLLLQTPAEKRFVSYEPALGPVDWRIVSCRPLYSCRCCSNAPLDDCGYRNHGDDVALDWVIVGGESGPGARPFDIQWARNTIRQCKEAGVACFVKQLGAKPRAQSEMEFMDDYRRWLDDKSAGVRVGERPKEFLRLKDRKGGDWSEWASDLRVREFPA